MRYIGTSFGKCLRSIMAGEVSERDVFLITASTRMLDEAGVRKVIEDYHRFPVNFQYDISQWPLEDVIELALRLYRQGKIHQPRMFEHALPLFHQYAPTWFEIFPPELLALPAAKNLWEQLKVVAKLYE